MAEVICDTSFLLLLASEHIKNISTLERELGTIEFVVPDIVISELEKLSRGQDLKKKVQQTMLF